MYLSRLVILELLNAAIQLSDVSRYDLNFNSPCVLFNKVIIKAVYFD